MYGWDMVWASPKRQRAVLIRHAADGLGKELMPGHLAHGGENAFVLDAPEQDLLFHHAAAFFFVIDHSPLRWEEGA